MNKKNIILKYPELQEIEPFDQLRKKDLQLLDADIWLIKLKKEKKVFKQGEKPKPYLYIVVKGEVEYLSATDPTRPPHVMELIEAPDYLGWSAFFTAEPYPVTAQVCSKKCTIFALPKKTLNDLINMHPVVERFFMRLLANRMNKLMTKIQEEHRNSLQMIETFPFQKRIGDIMVTDLKTCSPEDSIRKISQQLRKEKVTCLPVIEEDGRMTGIVTQNDLIHRVLADPARDPDTTAVREIMTAPVHVAMREDDYIYQALGQMRRTWVHHLPVVDSEEKPVGIITTRDLMRLRSHDTLMMIDDIASSRSIEPLKEIRQKAIPLWEALLNEGMTGPEVVTVISHINSQLHKKAVELNLRKMTEEHGPPPVDFCFFLMGSHGRGENLLLTDQDHGLILEDYPDERFNEVESWFITFADGIVDDLEAMGFSRCDGYVMSNNPLWRKRLREWRLQLRYWFARPDAAAVRYTTIFYDFEPIFGETSLAEKLRADMMTVLAKNHAVLRALFDEADSHRIPLGVFNRFITKTKGEHKGTIDLKRSGSLFIVEAMRVMALRQGITHTGTRARLRELVRQKAISEDGGEFLESAFQFLLTIMLRNQIERARAGQPITNHLDPEALGPHRQELLKDAFKAVGRLKDQVASLFGVD